VINFKICSRFGEVGLEECFSAAMYGTILSKKVPVKAKGQGGEDKRSWVCPDSSEDTAYVPEDTRY